MALGKGQRIVAYDKIIAIHSRLDNRISYALNSEAFAAFIQEHGISEFYIVGADAAACIKSTCFNMRKGGYAVHVLSDCITSYDKKKLPEMLAYYESKGCSITELSDAMQAYAENGDIEHEKAV